MEKLLGAICSWSRMSDRMLHRFRCVRWKLIVCMLEAQTVEVNVQQMNGRHNDMKQRLGELNANKIEKKKKKPADKPNNY